MHTIFVKFIFVIAVVYTGFWLYNYQNVLLNPFDIQNFGELFVAWTIFSVIAIFIEIYEKTIINRMSLTAALFGSIGSFIYILNNQCINYCYNTYVQIIPFICLFIIGIITMFCTSSGFIGVRSDDKKAVQWTSLKLLGLVVFAGIWALCIKQYLNHNMFYLFIPLYIIRWLYDRWGRQLRGEKSKSDWSFKW